MLGGEGGERSVCRVREKVERRSDWEVRVRRFEGEMRGMRAECEVCCEVGGERADCEECEVRWNTGGERAGCGIECG